MLHQFNLINGIELIIKEQSMIFLCLAELNLLQNLRILKQITHLYGPIVTRDCCMKFLFTETTPEYIICRHFINVVLVQLTILINSTINFITLLQL